MSLPQRTDLANDNGKPEDHLAAATAAFHDAVKGLDAPVELLASKIKAPVMGACSGGLHGDLVREKGHRGEDAF